MSSGPTAPLREACESWLTGHSSKLEASASTLLVIKKRRPTWVGLSLYRWAGDGPAWPISNQGLFFDVIMDSMIGPGQGPGSGGMTAGGYPHGQGPLGSRHWPCGGGRHGQFAIVYLRVGENAPRWGQRWGRRWRTTERAVLK